MKHIIISLILIYTLPLCSLCQTDQILVTGNYANVKLGDVFLGLEAKYDCKFYYKAAYESVSVSLAVDLMPLLQ